MTIGEHLNFLKEEFPITLNFSEFYYYENILGQHFLLHKPSGKKINNFKVSKKINILQQLNIVFDLNLSEIKIYNNDDNDHYIYSATSDSSFTLINREKGLFEGTTVATYTMWVDFGSIINHDNNKSGKKITKKDFDDLIFKYANGLPTTTEFSHPTQPEKPP